MRRFMLLAGFVSMMLVGCGGGGGSGIEGRFGSVIVGVSDYQYKPRGTYCEEQQEQQRRQRFLDEVIDTLTMKSEVIKNAAGQPITPSPVYIESYRVQFFSATQNNNCEKHSDCRQLFAGGYNGFVGLSIPPGGTNAYRNLILVPASWKMATLANYCLMQTDNCDYNAVIEFHGREIYSGKTQTIRFNIKLSFYVMSECPPLQ